MNYEKVFDHILKIEISIIDTMQYIDQTSEYVFSSLIDTPPSVISCIKNKKEEVKRDYSICYYYINKIKNLYSQVNDLSENDEEEMMALFKDFSKSVLVFHEKTGVLMDMSSNQMDVDDQ